ncbi:serine/threonine-protein kinase [Actinomycetes bacterium KLBMP 9797]
MSDRIVGDRYRLDEQVGRGGTATVWRGVDLDTGVPVAVKVLDREQAARPVALARLRREAQAVARLEHPNIIGSHGLGVDGDGGFLAMELVDGPTVADLLTTGGPLAVERAVAIAAQVCAALAAAHAAGVIHRDVKPSNLIVDHSGVVKVCDFGIARLQARDGDAALTAHSQTVGTCEFMAPEQAIGEPVDARSDLYALGCVLYAMLTARPPFLGDTAMAVLHQHLHKAPAPLRSVRGDVPVALDQLVGRLLAKRPDDRPATATDVRDELAAIRSAMATDTAAAALAADTAAAALATDTATAALATATPTAVLARVTAALSRPPGRHRMPLALPDWPPSWAAVRAWPRRWWSNPAGWRPSWPDARAWLRRWWLSVVAVALVLATVATVAAVVTGRDPDRRPAAAPAGGVPATAEAPGGLLEPAPTPTAATPTGPVSPTPAGSRTSPAAPRDRLGEFAATVQRLVDRGDLDARAGRDLLRMLAGVTTAVRSGHGDKAAERLRQIDERLVTLRDNGKLSRAGFAALAPLT